MEVDFIDGEVVLTRGRQTLSEERCTLVEDKQTWSKEKLTLPDNRFFTGGEADFIR